MLTDWKNLLFVLCVDTKFVARLQIDPLENVQPHHQLLSVHFAAVPLLLMFKLTGRGSADDPSFVHPIAIPDSDSLK